MNALIQSLWQLPQHSELTVGFIDAALKGVVLLLLAGGLSLLCRRASAAARHLIWLAAVVGLLFLPWLPALGPKWQRPLGFVSVDAASGNEMSLALSLAPAVSRPATGEQAAVSRGAVGASEAELASSARTQRITASFDRGWLVLVLAIWLAGLSIVAASVLAGQIQVRKLARRARPLCDDDWAALLATARNELNLRRGVTLLASADRLMPLTWGWWHPVVLVPAQAEQWPVRRRRIVLLHELAHVKRGDCLTELATQVACTLYWFNPLVWLAARRMCIERERACDDLVLNVGFKASEYANQLVEIARSFRSVPRMAGIAMARSSQLGVRVAGIVDAKRARGLRPLAALGLIAVIGGVLAGIGGWTSSAASSDPESEQAADALRQEQLERLKVFSAAKERHARVIAAKAEEEFFPEFGPFFDAAINGDWRTVTNMWYDFHRRHPQYENSVGDIPHGVHWSPVLETCLAYENVVNIEPRYTQIVVDDILRSIPPGSIYFGGTDPGRGLPTAFCRSHADADPFFVLTQNALADATYLRYLHYTFGDRIYTPTQQDSQRCFQEYLTDAQVRLQRGELKPGEDVRIVENRVQVSGQVAVMSINGMLTKVIFDQNPTNEFFIEESFPLYWMYPHLEPQGVIMKIHREPLAELSDEMVQPNREYWAGLVNEMIGDWLKESGSVQSVADFAERVHGRKNLTGFTGDARFIQNDDAQKMMSKLRSSQAGIYAWRVQHAVNDSDKARMVREADLAFRQAWALCPTSPEAVNQYVDLLTEQGRLTDASLVADTASRSDTKNEEFKKLAEKSREGVKRSKSSEPPK